MGPWDIILPRSNKGLAFTLFECYRAVESIGCCWYIFTSARAATSSDHLWGSKRRRTWKSMRGVLEERDSNR